jgi:hypothetical protein
VTQVDDEKIQNQSENDGAQPSTDEQHPVDHAVDKVQVLPLVALRD